MIRIFKMVINPITIFVVVLCLWGSMLDDHPWSQTNYFQNVVYFWTIPLFILNFLIQKYLQERYHLYAFIFILIPSIMLMLLITS